MPDECPKHEMPSHLKTIKSKSNFRGLQFSQENVLVLLMDDVLNLFASGAHKIINERPSFFN